jgi:phosphoribosyl-AMP cyclohydrolase / phosphoribosyl-ATP pyrophosphohydrolase
MDAQPDFEKNGGLLPAVIQDSRTGHILMLGYMNETALQQTRDTGKVTFFSRSRNTLWTKGEMSGNFLQADDITLDCDSDTILVKATPDGPTCHTGTDTCWGEKNDYTFSFLHQLEQVIADRRINPRSGSYTNVLFEKGLNKIAQKVGEEAVELVIEAKDKDDHLFRNEAADLLFHFMVLLNEKGISFNDVLEVLESRHR